MNPTIPSEARYLVLVDHDDDGDIQEILTVIREGRAPADLREIDQANGGAS